MIKRSSLTWPIVLAVVLQALIVVLLVIWIIGQAREEQWALLTVGTIFFALILIGVVVYFVWTIKEFRLNRRQANFIDSVTHELKSPIASIKLCLQTLDMRPVTAEQQREFHRFMLEDVQRLDSLIDHLLAVARIDHAERPIEVEDVPLEMLLRTCAAEVERRYQLAPDRVRIELAPCVVRGSPRDLEMVFLNLLDNAVKYGGQEPEVLVQSDVHPDRIVVRISDNGRGIRFELRRKIFQRFFRGGSELERTSKGTGLGLYIVKSLVGKMKGKISVHGRGPLCGATFEVELPGKPLPASSDAVCQTAHSTSEHNSEVPLPPIVSAPSH
ncbi:MAG TPA: HAMP domain-containing sensor histidine kinase [Planctomycetaceae bacterium]|nr:HAMP domain-containing sensor histidine kinase [Planctomycetaceae bacterium]